MSYYQHFKGYGYVENEEMRQGHLIIIFRINNWEAAETNWFGELRQEVYPGFGTEKQRRELAIDVDALCAECDLLAISSPVVEMNVNSKVVYGEVTPTRRAANAKANIVATLANSTVQTTREAKSQHAKVPTATAYLVIGEELEQLYKKLTGYWGPTKNDIFKSKYVEIMLQKKQSKTLKSK